MPYLDSEVRLPKSIYYRHVLQQQIDKSQLVWMYVKDEVWNSRAQLGTSDC